jgi:ubiquitin carboxyl-terminal hydrolase 8
MSAAVRIIYETAFQRILKRNPVLLVGGLRAWKNAFPAEVVAEADAQTGGTPDRTADDLLHRTERLKLTPSPGSSSSQNSVIINGINGNLSTFSTNGVIGVQPSANGPVESPSHEIWMPTRPRSGTDASTTSSVVEYTQEQPWTRSSYGMHQIPEHDRCVLWMKV